MDMNLYELYYLIGLQTEIIQKLKLVSEKIDLKQIDFYLEQLIDMKTAVQSYRH